MNDKNYEISYKFNILSLIMAIVLIIEGWMFKIALYHSEIIKLIFSILFITQFVILIFSTFTGIVQVNFNIFRGLKCKEKEFKKRSYILINFILLSFHFIFLIAIPIILKEIHIVISL